MSAMALFGRMCRFYGALIMPHRYVTVRHAGGNGLRSHLCGIELCLWSSLRMGIEITIAVERHASQTSDSIAS